MKMAKTTIHWMLLLSFLVVIGISTGSAQETPGGPDDNNEGNNDVIESGDIDPDTGLPEDSEELPEDEGELPEGEDADRPPRDGPARRGGLAPVPVFGGRQDRRRRQRRGAAGVLPVRGVCRRD